MCDYMCVCVIAGVCNCDLKYGGTDCTFEIALAPTVVSQGSNTLCESNIAACNRTIVRGEHFMKNVGSLTCHLTPIEVSPLYFHFCF